ncbi:tail fiber assembly protein [Providencia rettgeri]|nr:tail fiber assembly protein [Providencia rettgeri]
MKFYKDIHNVVYAYESDGSQDEFISDELIAISDKEAANLAKITLSKEQHIEGAKYQKQALLIEATNQSTPLQDAIDLGIATDKELIQLNAWKQYRVDLNRIDTSAAPDIAWPEKPQWPSNVISGVNKTWKWRQVCRRSPVPFCPCIRLYMVLGKQIAQAATSALLMQLTI